jgi:hypothetical protein
MAYKSLHYVNTLFENGWISLARPANIVSNFGDCTCWMEQTRKFNQIQS